jgi:putative membrane protein insertion efficiency factor
VKIGRWVAAGLVWVIGGYRRFISPLLGAHCRFYPSCSAYAQEALATHGLVRGGWLAVRRLGRCHPWNPGGIDRVPPRVSEARAGGASGGAACGEGLPESRAVAAS